MIMSPQGSKYVQHNEQIWQKDATVLCEIELPFEYFNDDLLLQRSY